MLQDKLGSRGRSWESRGLGVVGLHPTCFSSDLQESPECRSQGHPSLRLSRVSSYQITRPDELPSPGPQPADCPLLRRVHLKGRPRPEARAAHLAPSPRVADKPPPPCPTRVFVLTEKDPARLRNFMALACALSHGHRRRERRKMVSEDRVSRRALRACPRPLGRATLCAHGAPLLPEAGPVQLLPVIG